MVEFAGYNVIYFQKQRMIAVSVLCWRLNICRAAEKTLPCLMRSTSEGDSCRRVSEITAFVS